jgi:hypothetical protein
LFGLSGSTKETKQTRQTIFSIPPSRFLPSSLVDPHLPLSARQYDKPEAAEES